MGLFRLIIGAFCFITIFFLTGCKPDLEKEQVKIKVSAPQDIKKEITDELSHFISKDSILEIDSIHLFTFKNFKGLYKDFKPLWFNQTRLNPQGDSLYHIIANSVFYGLNKNQYHFDRITNYLSLIHQDTSLVNVTALVKADLLFSHAYFLMGVHVCKGRFSPDTMMIANNIHLMPVGWDSILRAAYYSEKLKAGLDSLEPKHYNYKMLKQELHRILQDSMLYTFDSIPFHSEPDSIQLKNLVVKNLIQQSFYDSTKFKNDSIRLAKAIVQLQKLWYIQPDGKLGKYTMQALSYNREKIIQQICMAMERWRWEPEKFPDMFTWINIPAFELTVFEKDTVVMQSAVVCGKPETPTPILKSKIDHLLIYPYWNVPYSIATKEILPAVQRDTTYIRRKNFEVLGAGNKVLDYTKLPWKKYTKDYLPVKFRQRIGEDNSLGVVKFNFNNPYGVYLHDTNSKKYFKTSSRAQSHGCIRLEKFSEFADLLVRDDSVHYTHDSLQLYFSQPIQRKLKLKKTMPIFIRYYTAWADSTGLKLYLDIYRKDEKLIELLKP